MKFINENIKKYQERKIKFSNISKGRYVKERVNSIGEKDDAYASIINYIQDNNFIIDGNPFEQYMNSEKNKFFTFEIYFPIKKYI